jgi:hypothetical protein
LASDGVPVEVVQRYLKAEAGRQEVVIDSNASRAGTGRARYVKAVVKDRTGKPGSTIGIGEGFVVELMFETQERLSNPSFGVVIRDARGQRIAQLITRITHGEMPAARTGGLVRLHVDRFDVLPGLYYLTLGLSIYGEQLDYVENALELEVLPREVYPNGKLPPPGSAIMYVPCRWSHEYD